MNTTRAIVPNLPIDPELVAAVNDWAPGEGARPDVSIEARPEGQRVRLTYLGVETGVLFGWGERVPRRKVQATLDRIFGVLAWRVTRPSA